MNNKYILPIIIGVLALGGIAVIAASKTSTPQAPQDNEPVVCTMDAKLCPDGSYVGRVAPSCEFAACPAPSATTTQACTKELKVCPGGSTVGRTGPNCSFAACPAVLPGPVSVQARLNQEVAVLGIRLTPLEVLEDSRCPQDVQCIQAGTVRLRVRIQSGLGTATQELRLDQPVTTEAERITLKAVLPLTKAGTPIARGDYIFTFEVVKR